MWEFLMLLALGAAGVWIWSGISAHERAVAAARSVCIRHHQQLLDETVAQVRVKLFRNASGSLLPKRTYRFEFTDDGDERRCGELSIHDGHVVDLHLELDGFTLYDHDDSMAEERVTAVKGQLNQNERP